MDPGEGGRGRCGGWTLGKEAGADVVDGPWGRRQGQMVDPGEVSATQCYVLYRFGM